jgi:hypothetical protein
MSEVKSYTRLEFAKICEIHTPPLHENANTCITCRCIKTIEELHEQIDTYQDMIDTIHKKIMRIKV